MTGYFVVEDRFGHPVAELPAMQPGDSVRVTMTDDGFDVVPLRWVVLDFDNPANNRWGDDVEQENDHG